MGIITEFTYCICSNISQGFYFLPGSRDPVSKRDQPLFRTGVYKLSVSTNSQKYKKMTALTSPLAVSLDFSATHIPTAQKAGSQVAKMCEHSLLPRGQLAMLLRNAYCTRHATAGTWRLFETRHLLTSEPGFRA